MEICQNNSEKRADPTNYQPIPAIAVVVKVFERIIYPIYEKLYHYLIKNSLLTHHQTGFSTLHGYGTS